MPRIALYDNLKSAVLERCGNAIRFHRPCSRSPATTASSRARWRWRVATRRGRVERAIRYVREAFFAGCAFADLDDLNAQAQAWCEGVAGARRCPRTPR